MTAPARRRREAVTPYFAGVVIEGNPSATLADVQRLVTERLVRHVAQQQNVLPLPSRGEDAAD